MAPSRTQIDRLGERLKTQHASDTDLSELDAYRRSFTAAYDKARSAARTFSRLEPTGREKSNASIIEKLRRESVRLSQIQDIVGCRIVVEDTEQQSRVVYGVADVLRGSRVVNRLAEPSHGYRAVHLIATLDDRPVEIQVRSVLQHRWAQLSEKFSDVIDPAIKYGGGPREVQDLLMWLSHDISAVEGVENVESESLLRTVGPIEPMTPVQRLKAHVHARLDSLDSLVQQLNERQERT